MSKDKDIGVAAGAGAFAEQDTAPAATARAGKDRFCWVCGTPMGFIENRYYDRRDTCESRECSREAREAERAERDEAHDRLDQDNGWER